MSYCRFGRNSDVYVYSDGCDWYVQTITTEPVKAHTLAELEAALHKLKSKGLKVPQAAFDRISHELGTGRSLITGYKILKERLGEVQIPQP